MSETKIPSILNQKAMDYIEKHNENISIEAIS